jgi:hypothetical protein
VAEVEEEIDTSYMRGFYLAKWTMIGWLDALPMRRFGPIGRAKLNLVNWLDDRLDRARRGGSGVVTLLHRLYRRRRSGLSDAVIARVSCYHAQ